MSNCSDCFNGCAEIVSDRCVKYTGVDVPILGIVKGDSLSYVEQALITFLTAALDGSGITITIDENDYCELVSQYLQECETVTALDLFKALVKAACNLQEQIDAINVTLDTLNAPYTPDCLPILGTEGTHDVVQAIITKLCEIDVSLTALALDVDTNYVKLADLNALIQDYLNTIAVTTKAYTKMIPFTAIEYYGPLSNFPVAGDSFDASGAGLNYWEKVYLCNGDNGTPDKRGRVAVGATTTPGLIPMSPAVAPGGFNPPYTVNGATDTSGANSTILTIAQLPVHNHTASAVSTVSPNPHSHTLVGSVQADPGSGSIDSCNPGTIESAGVSASVNLSVTTNVTVNNEGSGQPHSNVQPGIGAYYIMYIP